MSKIFSNSSQDFSFSEAYPENKIVKQLPSPPSFLSSVPSEEQKIPIPLVFSFYHRKQEKIAKIIHALSGKTKETKKMRILQAFISSLKEEEIDSISLEHISSLVSLEEAAFVKKIKEWKESYGSF